MLHELPHVSQHIDDYFRRCFTDENLFLITWYRADKTLCGFQFTYGSGQDSRVLTWLPETGFSRTKVDYGGADGWLHPAPILIACDDFDEARALASFRSAAENLPLGEKHFVEEKLSQLRKG